MGKPVMQAVNVTKNIVVSDHVVMAKTMWSRFWGLMGKHGMPEGQGLWIEPCCDIHSLFMRFEFDALFLDKDGEVLHMVERMKPWRISKFVRGGRAVLELDGGMIAKTGTVVGDMVELRK